MRFPRIRERDSADTEESGKRWREGGGGVDNSQGQKINKMWEHSEPCDGFRVHGHTYTVVRQTCKCEGLRAATYRTGRSHSARGYGCAESDAPGRSCGRHDQHLLTPQSKRGGETHFTRSLRIISMISRVPCSSNPVRESPSCTFASRSKSGEDMPAPICCEKVDSGW